MSKSNPLFKRIVFAVVLLIPFIYSFFYLKAYWDPYGNMERIPVALVNEDSGDKGEKIVNKLLEGNVLDFEKTDKDTAQNGLRDKKYYATITFPSDFTKDLESATETTKTPAVIEYSPNQKSNYLASQIINRVVLSVEQSVRSEVASTVVSTLSDKLDEIPAKLEQISDGTSQLQSGANQLSNGLYTLDNKYTLFDNGLGTAYSGSKQLGNGLVALNSGLNSLNNGAQTLNSGVAQINSALSNVDTSKLDALKSGVNQLNSGADTLSNNLKTYVTGVEQLATGLKTVETTITATITNVTTEVSTIKNSIIDEINNIPSFILSDTLKAQLISRLEERYTTAQQSLLNRIAPYLPAINQLRDGVNQLLDTSIYGVTPGQALVSGSEQLTNGTAQLQAGVSELSALTEKLNLLKDSLAQVEQGTAALQSGTDQLLAGSNTAVSGSNTLANGLNELKVNSTAIKNGISTLDNGSFTLANGITTLKNSVDNGISTSKDDLKKLDGLAEFTANPVEIKETDMGKVDAYGISFTPLFVSIGLWVGALMTYVVLFYDQEHRFGLLDSKNRSLKQSAVYLGIAVGLGLLTAFLLKLCIGFSVTNIFGYYASSILIAITFMSIIQCLITLFGDAGKLLALIILVLQLAASGGTFPVETVDSALSWLNPFLPMTYSINLVKENVISSDNLSAGNIVVLIGFLVVNFGLTAGYYILFHKKANKS